MTADLSTLPETEPAADSLVVTPSAVPSPGPTLVEGVDYELLVSTLGDTVWLNAADGSCIGRFSKRYGIDVHHSATEQMAGSRECVFCTHQAASADDWSRFRREVREHYGIEVPEGAISF